MATETKEMKHEKKPSTASSILSTSSAGHKKLHKDPPESRPQTAKSSKKAPSVANAEAMTSPGQNSLSTTTQDRPDTARLPTPSIIVHGDDESPPGPKELLRPHPPRTSSLQPLQPTSDEKKARPSTAGANEAGGESFLTLSTPIPTGSFDDLMSPDRMQFSNRGSIILLEGGNKRWSRDSRIGEGSGLSSPRKSVINGSGIMSPRTFAGDNGTTAGTTVVPDGATRLRARSLVGSTRSARVLSADEVSLSQRVRTMYEHGTEDPFTESTLLEEEDEDTGDGNLSPNLSPGLDMRLHLGRTMSGSSTAGLQKQEHETAGGIEYWEDIRGEEVDRYGFIVPRPIDSRGSRTSGTMPEGMSLQRVSTPLLEASNVPRKKNSVLRRIPSRNSTRNEDGTPSRQASRRSLKPQGSVYSHKSNRSISNSQTSLRSPLSSKHRKLLVEAGDMLTLPPGMSEFKGNSPQMTQAMRQKEWEREAKWKKMGRLRPGSKNGSGMQFDFDVKDPKLISRTWKGIPDRWRASAWYSFLDASAKKHDDSPTEDKLFTEFHEFQSQNSADDVQIDCDVPRTINRHIMFRRRYRGGQRLLFRVLHALSLYFPEVGYVQGMATLAATLLCYYDEEHTFVMMVRLWQLRGLHRLYESGFEGLMDALSEFEKQWLEEGDVAKKLVSLYHVETSCCDADSVEQEELSIHSTAYGTRWYLTLFNYSIPFPAQLRVWDVFMLLGDESNLTDEAGNRTTNRFRADLDILHATSAALIDATRDIILDSDFENAMKVLTSWIPIKDEDLLMRVANAEWKQRKKRAGR
jgi:hypothetical protein